MEIRSVEAGMGWQWIADGFTLFRKNPLIWIVLCIILLLFAVAMAAIPMLGQFVFTLLSPVLLAGLMTGCKALEQGEELEIAHLFAGFQKNPTPLITIGGVYLVGQVLIIGVAMLIGGSVMLDLLMGGKEFDRALLMSMMGSIMFAMLVAMALSIPLMMATWFAPLLVIFDDMPALAAMRLSFFACLKNFMPFLVYGIMLLVLAVVAAIPFGLGFLVLVPTLFASIYASYKNIFARTTEVVAATS